MDERQHWSSRTAFILAAVGSAVGLGNVWRFPFIAYQNGGGAFFIPYFAALITAGIPIMILEYGLGILYQKGAPGALEELSSSFKWVGWLALLVGLTISFYYVPVIGWSWKYLAASPDLSWTKPTRNGTVFLKTYATYDSDEEKKRLKEKLSGVELIEEGKLNESRQELRSMWGSDEEVMFYHPERGSDDGWSDRNLREFVKEVYRRQNGDRPPEAIRVLYLPHSYHTSTDPEKNLQKWMSNFYRSKLEEKRDLNAPFQWYTDLAPGRKVDLIKVMENASKYFSRTVLGGFHPGDWQTENLLNRALNAVERHGRAFSHEHLEPRYFETQKSVSVPPVLVDDVRDGRSDWEQRARSFYNNKLGIYLARFDVDGEDGFTENERERIVRHLHQIQQSGTVQVHFLETITPAFARVSGRLRYLQEQIEQAGSEAERNRLRNQKEGVVGTLRTGLTSLIERREGFHGGESFDSRMWQIDWSLAGWTALTWLLIFLIIFNGIETVGKVVMWSVPIPLVLLGVLIIRGLFMEGALVGLEEYLVPEWDQVAKPGVWRAAYSQVFFTLSLGFGIMIAYASYQSDDSDIVNNSFITSFANCATSFYAGFAVFSVLGGLAVALNQPVSDVMTGGPGLVFNVYPVALGKLPLGGFWGMVFFASLLLLGIDSAFSIVQAVVTGLQDIFPDLRQEVIVTVVCVFGLLISVFFFCQRSGMMWLDIMDHFVATSFGLPMVGLLECVAVGMFFSTSSFREKVNAQSEIQINRWWDIFIQILIPVILLFLLWDATVQLAGEGYNNYHKISEYSVLLGGWIYFAVILFLAFVFGGNWLGTIWWITGLLSLLVLYYLGMTWPMAIMTVVGFLLLFGGLLTCLFYVESEPDVESETAVE
jgi:SNF family Na+-dependent transporter